MSEGEGALGEREPSREGRRAGAVVAILLAAGSSRRMRGAAAPDREKLWADLDGAPLVARPLAMLASLPAVERVVVVAPAARHADLARLGGATELLVVEGGARRQDSLSSGVAAAPDASWYVVHDAARPLASRSLALRVLDAARRYGAALPGVPAVDTIKEVDGAGRVVRTLPREPLRAAQTPQAFSGELLRRALAAASRPGSSEATDCASLVERIGETVWLVEGEQWNVKVTTAADLSRVRAGVHDRGTVEGGGPGEGSY